MTPENRNLILAVSLSMIVLLGWQMFVIQPELEKEAAEQQRIATELASIKSDNSISQSPTVDTPTPGGEPAVSKPPNLLSV